VDSDRAAFRFVVRGRVQGVGFRRSAQHEALRLGLAGWVGNTAAGDVEGAAEVGGEKGDELDRRLAFGEEAPERAGGAPEIAAGEAVGELLEGRRGIADRAGPRIGEVGLGEVGMRDEHGEG